MHTFMRRLTAALLVSLAGVLTVSPSWAQITPPTYHVTDLGVFTPQPLVFGNAQAVNSLGIVVGEYEGADGTIHGFLYQKGTFTDLGNLGTANTFATSINNAKVVAGQSVDASGTPFGIVYQDGVMTELPNLPNAIQGEAEGINNKNVIVGECEVLVDPTDPTNSDTENHAVEWNNGIATDLGFLPSGTSAEALSINNKGEIVGDGTDSTGTTNVVEFTPTGPVNLGTMGGFDAAGFHVNNHGQIVGFFVEEVPPFQLEAFAYQDGVSTQIPDLPGATSNLADANNDNGQIVGNCTLDTGTTNGYLNEDGQTYDLATLLDSGSQEYTVPNVLFISNEGQITAGGVVNGNSTPVVLTPDNTPDSGSIAGLSPSAAPAGAIFTLDITGAGFTGDSTVDWNNTPLVTHFVSQTELKADIPSSVSGSLPTVEGTANIVVVNPKGASSPAAFTVNAPGPYLTSIQPKQVNAGHKAFTLTVNGSGFLAGDTALFGATPLATTFVSPTQLTATVTADLVASAGTANVTVTDGIQTSNALVFTIN